MIKEKRDALPQEGSAVLIMGHQGQEFLKNFTQARCLFIFFLKPTINSSRSRTSLMHSEADMTKNRDDFKRLEHLFII